MIKYLGIALILPLGTVFGSLASILEPIELRSHDQTPAEALRVKPQVEKISQAAVTNHSQKLVKDEHFSDTISVPIYKINSIDVIRELGKNISKHYTVSGELKVSLMRDWKTISTKSPAYRIEFNDLPIGELRSQFTATFKILTPEKEIGSWSIPVRCEVLAPVYFTKERMSRGADLLEGSLKIRTMDILKLSHKPVLEGIDLAKYELSKTVTAEKPLLWNSVTIKPNVRKGKVLDLIATEGGMRIATKCIALQNGLINDFIPVRNIQSRRDVQAQIINESTAKVYF